MKQVELFDFLPIGWFDLIDIALVAFLIYQLYHIVKGTAAIRIFLGILAIYLFWNLVQLLQMELLSEILGQFISVGVIALIIVFQQELRRFLLMIGNTNIFNERNPYLRWMNWSRKKVQEFEIDAASIADACIHMSKSKTGALIVIARRAGLDNYISTGQRLDAFVSSDLLQSIFFKNSPLHDGAVIIQQNSIRAAGCILPVSENKNITKEKGMRHRAAVGATEDSDALAIVVSEQTGDISLVQGDVFQIIEGKEDLESILKKEFGS